MKRPLVMVFAGLLILALVAWIVWPSASPAKDRSAAASAPATSAPAADLASPAATPESRDFSPDASAPRSSQAASTPPPGAPVAAASRPVSPSTPAAAAPSTTSISPAVGNSAPAGSPPLQFASDAIPTLLEKADLSDPETRALIVARMAEIQESRRESVFEKADRLGIPTRIDGPGNRVAILYDFRGDEPVYRSTRNRNAAISTGANLLAPTPYSLTGSGTKVGVWDGGSVRSTHVELSGRVSLRNASAALDDHATHVAGTIAASGVSATAKGMAPSATIESYDWNSDYTEMTAAGAATAGDASTRLSISNHSYGYDAVTDDMGRYETEARTVDALANSLPFYLPMWAAGNEQNLLTALGGYQSITFNGLAKNVLTVGAVNDAVSNGVRSPAAAAMSSFSSWGPTDDGRIKPDVVANGVTVTSSIATGNSSYATYSGTSMATPSTAGSAALLAQLYAREFSGQFLRASTLKGLLIHTADDLGNPGPDYRFGWGLVNVQRAADLILAHKASLANPKIIENTLTNSQKSRTHTFAWDGSSPIRATLVWTDPAGAAQAGANSRTPNLVNNLDLALTAPNGTTVFRPFVMPFVGTWTQASMNLHATTGKNNTDNVEQVFVGSPNQAGTYTVTVSLDGTLSGSTTQTYSLLVSGGASVAANPAPNVTLSSPTDGATTLPGQPVNVAASATDTSASGGSGVISQVEFFAGSTSLGVDATAPYAISWPPTVPGTYSVRAVATDSEGASSSSSSAAVHVLSGNGAPSIAALSPTTAAVGASIIITGQNLIKASAVRFNGTDAAAFTVNSLAQITAIVTQGATTGPLSVITPSGIATSTANFTVAVPPVVISQIYGGGGNSGATLNADFVELHNRSNASVSLAGWSIQYASASGTTWNVTNLANAIAPGGYYLVRLAGGGNGVALPTADATGTTNIAAASGKIALRNSTAAFAGSSPLGQSGCQDFVGYGFANAYEGTAAAQEPSSTTAIVRAGNGATDTENNAADFSTAAPNPRNSAGATVAPVVPSPLTAGGTVGSPFSYQTTASNGPTSFAATNLPGGLSINTSSGLISGTPTTAGAFSVTLSATNSAGTGTATLNLTIVAGGGATGLLSEDFGSITSGNNTSNTGSSLDWSGNTSFPPTSNAFQAGGAVRLGTANSTGSMTSRPLDLSGTNGTLEVSLHVKGWTTVEGSLLVTISGRPAQTVTYTNTMSQAFETKTLTFTGASGNPTLRIETTAKRAFVDQVVVTSMAPATPVISLSGTPAVVDTTYGTPSPSPASFMISATDLGGAVLLTAPAGFELSQTPGGISGYAPTQSVGTTGTLSAVTIHVRLAAGIAAGTYGGSVLATSPGALPVSLTLPTSAVRPKVLVVTADNRSKPFGTVFVPGTTAFTASGLVSAETIGGVTLAATGGSAAYDAVGVYEITASNANGGTFAPSSYDISYQPGVLTVTAPSFSEWIGGTFGGAAAGTTADPDGDGLANLTEYFMALDPDGPSAGPQVTVVGNELRLLYRRSKAVSGVTGLAEWSTTLGTNSWSSTGVTDTLLTDHGPYETRQATVPLQNTDRRKFLRLRIVPSVE